MFFLSQSRSDNWPFYVLLNTSCRGFATIANSVSLVATFLGTITLRRKKLETEKDQSNGDPNFRRLFAPALSVFSG